MRTLLLVAASAAAFACATTPSGSAAESRLPSLKAVVAAARTQPWGADLKQIPATVIEVGDLASVPYVSMAGAEIELNVYGDPERPAGIEVGTKSESPETRAALRKFIGGLLAEGDRPPLDALGDGKLVESAGLMLEITPPTAEDGFGAWWVTAFHAAGMKAAKASVGDINELAQPDDADLTAVQAFDDVGFHPTFRSYARFRPGKRVWATAYFTQDGTYRRRK